MGRSLGDPEDPLLVAVRSGAKFSMPGMMETVLNVGLNDGSVQGLAARSGNERFAWDSYRRLVQMFGATVLGIDADVFHQALDGSRRSGGPGPTPISGADDLRGLVAIYQELVEKHAGRRFPQDPREQLDLAIEAVFDSWNTDRARLYRRQERIPDDLGTAVNVIAMVFGNLGEGSGTGVAFTRDPCPGSQGVYGDYLENAQGEDVVAGIRNTLPLAELEQIDKTSYDELIRIMDVLEKHYRDMCDIEFTIERGKLWMLQTRVGKRTPERGVPHRRAHGGRGLDRRGRGAAAGHGQQLAQLMFPRFDESVSRDLLATGMGASPGAAVGRAVFDSATAVEWAEPGRAGDPGAQGDQPRRPRTAWWPRKGILTSRGGKTSHAAVVARGMGRTCVCGAEALDVDAGTRRFTVHGGDADQARAT